MLLKGDSVSTDLVKDIGDTVNWIDTVSKNNLPIFKNLLFYILFLISHQNTI